MKKTKILLIDGNSNDVKTFKELMLDKHWDIQIADNSLTPLQEVKKNLDTHWIVLLSEKAKPMQPDQLKTYLEDIACRHTLVIVRESEATRLKRYETPQLVKPYNKKTLDIVEVFVANPPILTADSKLYGINYLREISCDNQLFIQDMLKTFVVSVGPKLERMEELLVALEYPHNREALCQLAHSLKPSFEMVENYKGKEICHAIFYGADTNKMAKQVLELKNIYENICKVLVSDYPELIES